MRDLITCIMSALAVVVIVLSVRIDDALASTVAISRYRELLNSRAVVENHLEIERIIERHADWTTVPKYLCPATRGLRLSTLLAIGFPLCVFLIKVAALGRYALRYCKR
jgi:hypothetical protein